jgi:hypothetical protein
MAGPKADMSDPFGPLLKVRALAEALDLQRRILFDFYQRSLQVIGGSCSLHSFDETDLRMERNLFSTLFLAAQRCVGIPEERMMFYGLINQCMRAWVTACDNLLDEESKSVIPFSLGQGGFRFQSVLTIMTADRILSNLLDEETAAGNLPPARARALSQFTLHVLIPSGIQEHQEELGTRVILPPDEVLQSIHTLNTGLLFEGPIRVAELAGDAAPALSAQARAGLDTFGLACQILDDIVDLQEDLRRRHHNFVLSLAVHKGLGNSSKTVSYAEVDLKSLPLESATREAHLHSSRLFADARAHLQRIGLPFSGAEWESLVNAVMVALRVPQGTAAPTGDPG